MKDPVEGREFRDTVNIQPDLQNPHDGENSQQKASMSDDGIPKNIDELVAEHRFGDPGRDERNDTVNTQPRTTNPHNTSIEPNDRGLDNRSKSEIRMHISDAKTQGHTLYNSETLQCFRETCELLDGKDHYMMLEIGPEINIVAMSDGETFQLDGAYDPDAETDYNPVVELIEQTAPDHIQKSLLNYEVVSDDKLNPKDHIDIGDSDDLQGLMEAPGTFYVAPGLQNHHDI